MVTYYFYYFKHTQIASENDKPNIQPEWGLPKNVYTLEYFQAYNHP